jgi:hypothetical protein
MKSCTTSAHREVFGTCVMLCQETIHVQCQETIHVQNVLLRSSQKPPQLNSCCGDASSVSAQCCMTLHKPDAAPAVWDEPAEQVLC